MEFLERIKKYNIEQGVSLAGYTTWKVGGNADYLVIVNKRDNLVDLVLAAIEFNIPYLILGQGANVLISDNGFKGLVIINRCNEIKLEEGVTLEPFNNSGYKKTRSEVTVQNYKLSFGDLDYDEEDLERKVLKVDSGVVLGNLFHEGIKHGLTGLQWYSGIPATVGGAVYNNIHGGNHLINEVILGVEYLNEQGEVVYGVEKDLGFAYDYSNFHENKNVILSVSFALYIGDIERAKSTWNEWAIRKKHQPRNSAGSTWKNLSPDEQTKAAIESPSASYIIDQIAHLKGLQFGQAVVSHSQSNFIETFPGATAQDVVDVMRKTREVVFDLIGIKLTPEIFFIGFDKNPLE